MPVLDICKRVMAEVGWPVPVAIASSVEATAQQIFAICNTELRSLSEGFKWPHLEIEYLFDTVPDQVTYYWPSDFRMLAPHSIFDAAQYYEIKGSMPLQEWHQRKYGLYGSLDQIRYRVGYPLGAPAIELTPAPSDVRQLVAVYYTNQYAIAVGGASVPLFVVDTDKPKVPERLIELGVKWRFRRAKGIDFSAELAEYTAVVQAQFAQYLAPGEIQVGGRRPYDTDGITSGYIPDQGFG